MIPVFFARQLDATAADALPPPSLVIWSETAIPWSLERAASVLDRISTAAGETPVLLGVQRSKDGRHYNSLVSLDTQGRLLDVYDKHHLVPFGEYFPLSDWLDTSGLAQLVPGGYAAGPGAQVLDVAGVGPVLPLICYEAVFAHNLMTEIRPRLIVHATNDAWFGPGAGPLQHLAQARMRAIEQGLPVARAANTGVSAMIGPYGRILASLPLNEAGYIDAPLPVPLPPTLYSRTKDAPLAALFLLGLVFSTFRRRSRNTH